LPTLFYQLANFWAIRNFELGPKQAVQNYLSLISPMLKILLAAAIIFQGKGLIKLISHLRTIVDKKVDSRKVANGA